MIPAEEMYGYTWALRHKPHSKSLNFSFDMCTAKPVPRSECFPKGGPSE